MDEIAYVRSKGDKRKAEAGLDWLAMYIVPKFFVGKDIKIGSVTRGEPKDTFAAVIDRAEHGRETDENP